MKPILMSTEMVKATLEDRKGQTRRVIKLKPHPTGHDWHAPFCQDDYWVFTAGFGLAARQQRIKCPYQVGDRLWVRETWQDYCPIWKGHWCGHGTKEGIAKEHQPVYKADEPEKWLRDGRPPVKWKPSIFMPKWASRLTLEITGVRVERVQEISEEDARAEGIILPEYIAMVGWPTYHHQFMLLWDSLNAKRGCGWDVNPWVWVLEFKRVEALQING